MTRNVLAALVAALAVMATACNGKTASEVTAPVAITDGGDGTAVATATSPALLGTWRLVSLQPTGAPVQTVPQGTLFTVDFGADGRISAVVDCNRCGGGYLAGAETLTVSPMACTRAYCTASAPFDSTFEVMLGGSHRWRVEGTSLKVFSEGGTLTCTR
jgi:heat shock protein HslJ